MNKRAKFSQRMGISTLALQGVTLEDAIDLAFETGFGVFELVPGLYGRFERFDRSMREKLRTRLRAFDLVTLHTSQAKFADGSSVNIASSKSSHRRRSVDNYLAHIELALDVGAQVITFHPAPVDKQADTCQSPEAYLEFADLALGAIGDRDIRLGYEFFDADLVTRIGDPRFGLLFDVGHAATRFDGVATGDILELMRPALPVAVEFHFHGVELSDDGQKTDHLPFKRCNVVDYKKILRSIHGSDFDGPLVFEIGIFNQDQAVQNLSDAIQARTECAAAWKQFE